MNDLLIRGGTLLDPSRNIYEKADILIRDKKIVVVPFGEEIKAKKEIDATGYLVLPGLIDFHVHIFHTGTNIGYEPDLALLPQGVTTAVDQGSAGPINFDCFFKTVIRDSIMRIYSTLNVAPAGLATLPYSLESVDPNLFQPEKTIALFEKYNKYIIGLKIRQNKEVAGKLGLAPLESAVKMADKIGCRIVVHTTNSPGNTEDLVALLRKGDIFTHMYHVKGNSIINDAMKVRSKIREARDRGVLFGSGDGKSHCSLRVAKSAINDNFEPDIISADLGSALFARNVFGLPLIMSKYLNLGISLKDVVKACTEIPARLIGMDGKIGTLMPGAYADIAIFKLKKMSIQIQDLSGEILKCKQVLLPQMTILNGRVVYSSLGFYSNILKWER